MLFSFHYSLPLNQDCHEMWSKRRRRQLRQEQEAAALGNPLLVAQALDNLSSVNPSLLTNSAKMANFSENPAPTGPWPASDIQNQWTKKEKGDLIDSRGKNPNINLFGF